MGSWELRNGKAILPEGYEKIEDGKYEDCINLTSIVLPESVTEIGNSAFWGCENLKEIVFSDAITSVGDCAFINCKNLKKVVLPKSLKTIGSSVFAGCENLKEVVIPDSVTSIGKHLFGNNTFDGITVFKKGTAKDAAGNTFKILDSGMLTYEICDALKSVYCYVKDPNQIKMSLDTELNGYQATLYVPADSVKDYQNMRPWNKFKLIREIPGTEKETTAKENPSLMNIHSLQNNNNNRTMTQKLIPEDLDLLIQECLTDGILTPKERDVILRKAEKMGLDRDEIDIYLDAQVQKIEQATDAAINRRKGTSCPFCGAYIQQLTNKCPECNRDLTPEATQELAEILDNLEDALINMKSDYSYFERHRATVEKYIHRAKMYYGNHPKIIALLAEIDKDMAIAENRYKSAKRTKALLSAKDTSVDVFVYLIKNKWFWGGLPVFIGILCLLLGEDDGAAMWLGLLALLIGLNVLMFVAMKAADD